MPQKHPLSTKAILLGVEQAVSAGCCTGIAEGRACKLADLRFLFLVYVGNLKLG